MSFFGHWLVLFLRSIFQKNQLLYKYACTCSIISSTGTSTVCFFICSSNMPSICFRSPSLYFRLHAAPPRTVCSIPRTCRFLHGQVNILFSLEKTFFNNRKLCSMYLYIRVFNTYSTEKSKMDTTSINVSRRMIIRRFMDLEGVYSWLFMDKMSIKSWWIRIIFMYNFIFFGTCCVANWRMGIYTSVYG